MLRPRDSQTARALADRGEGVRRHARLRPRAAADAAARAAPRLRVARLSDSELLRRGKRRNLGGSSRLPRTARSSTSNVPRLQASGLCRERSRWTPRSRAGAGRRYYLPPAPSRTTRGRPYYEYRRLGSAARVAPHVGCEALPSVKAREEHGWATERIVRESRHRRADGWSDAAARGLELGPAGFARLGAHAECSKRWYDSEATGHSRTRCRFCGDVMAA